MYLPTTMISHWAVEEAKGVPSLELSREKSLEHKLYFYELGIDNISEKIGIVQQ